VVLLGILIAFLLWRNGAQIAAWVERRLNRFPRIGRSIGSKISAFSEGLNTIHNARSLLAATIISLVIWCLVVCAYWAVTRSYHDGSLDQLGPPEVILLMFFSIAGGLVQLPFVGGGSQVLTIGALKSLFDIGPELATSCGILLWLVTFVSVTPLGLLLARREHVSFLKLAEQEERAELAHAGKSNHPD